MDEQAVGLADVSRGAIFRAVIEEADELAAAYCDFNIEPLKVGPGQGPTRTLTVRRERLTLTASEQGFPTLTTASLPDDRVTFAHIRATPPGSRWCEIDLEPGTVVVLGPAAEHHATNRPGLDLTAAQIDLELVDELADRVGLQAPSLRRGSVTILPASTPGTAAAKRALSHYRAVASSGSLPGPVYDEDLALAALALRSIGHHAGRAGAARRIDNREVVRACLDFAESVGRIPSISELCLAARVSERRLRHAFTAEFDTPPSRVLRVWALAEARRRLSEPRATSVTSVALDLGFEHLGRFAGHYRDVYGESPSTTFRSASSGCRG